MRNGRRQHNQPTASCVVPPCCRACGTHRHAGPLTACRHVAGTGVAGALGHHAPAPRTAGGHSAYLDAILQVAGDLLQQLVALLSRLERHILEQGFAAPAARGLGRPAAACRRHRGAALAPGCARRCLACTNGMQLSSVHMHGRPGRVGGHQVR